MTPLIFEDFTFFFLFLKKEYTLWTHAESDQNGIYYQITYGEADFSEFGEGCQISESPSGTFIHDGGHITEHNDFYSQLINVLKIHLKK